ncbi:recombinase family protein, partial [Bosea sp. CS1GBMeth4]|uniref:recombinase family protein n=1 Tax=Bosea sp. CS1GBMeth4 TaxID=1892849 RepID=UPI001644560F
MINRTAIYARYSSENQRDASIEDQIELCRRYAAAQGWQVVSVFSDRAISGTTIDRPGYQDLLAEARRGKFDVIVVEALDRLSRKLSEIARLHDELQFTRIGLHAVSLGRIETMHVGMLGTMAQIYIADLREKTRRGQLGRILQGRAASGKAFGYDIVQGAERGERVINQAEAATVRRIFQLFANGVSPRGIAHRLNGEAIPGPDRRPWLDTTIRGQKERGTGILNNELYAGELVWNRCSYVKDPSTGRRLARPNPQEQWERRSVPELRIVDDELWQAAKRRQEATAFEMGRNEEGNALNRAHRRRYLLSGLLTCGCCGARYTLVAAGRYGCAGRRSKGLCQNERTIDRRELEERILSALREQLLTPELVAEFARAYQEECNRSAAEAERRQTDATAAFAAIQRKINGIMAAIEDGLYQPSMKQRLAELEREKCLLGAELSDPAERPAVLVHPNLAQAYRRRVAELESLLEDPDLRDEAIEAIRSMIETTVVAPYGGGGVSLELHGDSARILALCSEQAKAPS